MKNPLNLSISTPSPSSINSNLGGIEFENMISPNNHSLPPSQFCQFSSGEFLSPLSPSTSFNINQLISESSLMEQIDLLSSVGQQSSLQQESTVPSSKFVPRHSTKVSKGEESSLQSAPELSGEQLLNTFGYDMLSTPPPNSCEILEQEKEDQKPVLVPKKRKRDLSEIKSEQTECEDDLIDSEQDLNSDYDTDADPEEKMEKDRRWNISYILPKSIIKCISVKCKTRREKFSDTIPSIMYASLKYSLYISAELGPEFPKDASFLLARIQVVNAKTLQPITKFEKPLKGQIEVAITKISKKKNEKDNLLEGTFICQYASEISYHREKKLYRLRFHFFLPSDEKTPIAIATSPKIKVFARKPNKKNYSKEKKLKNQDSDDYPVSPLQQITNHNEQPPQKKQKVIISHSQPRKENYKSGFDVFSEKLEGLLEIKEQLSDEEKIRALHMIAEKFLPLFSSASSSPQSSSIPQQTQTILHPQFLHSISSSQQQQLHFQDQLLLSMLLQHHQSRGLPSQQLHQQQRNPSLISPQYPLHHHQQQQQQLGSLLSSNISSQFFVD